MNTRIIELQKYMVKNAMEACLLKLPENVVLFSHYWPRNGFSFIFLTSKGSPCLIAPEGGYDDPINGVISDVRRFGWVKVSDGNPYDN